MSRGKKIARAVAIVLGLALAAALLYFGRVAYIAAVKPESAFATKSVPASAAVTSATAPSATPEMTPDGEADSEIEDESPSPVPTETPIPLDPEFMQGKVNVLVLGWDESPERSDDPNDPLYRDEQNNFRSDVIMLLVVDFNEKQADLISIPRDSYAEIYDTKGKWKINAAFAKGGAAKGEGFSYAMQTVSMLMGDVPIDHYVGVNMDGLKALVDAVGGVDYDVDVRIALNGRVLEKGLQHLDGQQAMDYMRARKGISTDIGRIDRQQRMMMTLFEQMQSSGQIVNIPKIFTALKDMVWTNLSLEQIASLAVFAAQLEPAEDMRTHTLKGEYMSAYGAYFYVLNQSSKGKLIEEVYGFKPKFDKVHDLSYVRAEMAERARLEEEAALAEAAALEEAGLLEEGSLPIEGEAPQGASAPLEESAEEMDEEEQGLQEMRPEDAPKAESEEGPGQVGEAEIDAGNAREPVKIGKKQGTEEQDEDSAEAADAA